MEQAYHILTHHHKYPLHETRAFLHHMLKHAGLASKYKYHSLHDMIRALYHHLPAHKPLSLEQRQAVLDMVKSMPKKTQGRALHWTTHAIKIPLTFLFHSGLIYFPLLDENKSRASTYLKNEKELLLEGLDPDDPKLRHAGKLYRILTEPILAHALANEYDTMLQTLAKRSDSNNQIKYVKPEIDDVSRCGECHELMEKFIPGSPMKNMTEQEMVEYLTSKGYNVSALQNRDYETFIATAPEIKSTRKMVKTADSKSDPLMDGMSGPVFPANPVVPGVPLPVAQPLQVVPQVPGAVPVVQSGPSTAYTPATSEVKSPWYQWFWDNKGKVALGAAAAAGVGMWYMGANPVAWGAAGLSTLKDYLSNGAQYVYDAGRQMLVSTGLSAGAQAVMGPGQNLNTTDQYYWRKPDQVQNAVLRTSDWNKHPENVGLFGPQDTSASPLNQTWGSYLSNISNSVAETITPYGVLTGAGAAALYKYGVNSQQRSQQQQIDDQYRQELSMLGIPAQQLAILNSQQLAQVYNDVLVKQAQVRMGNQAPMDSPEIAQMRQWMVQMSNQGIIQVPAQTIMSMTPFIVQQSFVNFQDQLRAMGRL